MKRSFVLCLLFLFALGGVTATFAQQEDKKKKKKKISQQVQEEELDYFAKWLREDVYYIIAPEEQDLFEQLTTDDERDAFIEQFWFRRDPDPTTAQNETKEEHYRRIAYVNEKYASGKPGWKTDRGRTYITFGPPDIIEDHPSGGTYYRKSHEGGGYTSTYPFQLWIYNNIEGMGTEIEVEFVDPSWSGEYRMAFAPWEKDALLHAGSAGPTDAEIEGRLKKTERGYFSPGNLTNTNMQKMEFGMRAQDKPFQRMARFYQLQQAEPIKFTDLKQMVKTEVIFKQFPFRMGYEFINIDTANVLVPVTMEFANSDLTFSEMEGGQLRGQVNIYGVIQNLTGRFVTEFEDTLVLEFPAAQREARRQRKSVYQKTLLLQPGRYKLTMAVKDDASDQVGTTQVGLILPTLDESNLDASSVILARSLQWVESVPETLVPFVLGDFKVVPNVTRAFSSGDDMGVYFQVYNNGIDQASLNPSLEVEYQILQDGKVIKSVIDPKQNSVLNYGDRLILLQAVDLEGLEPGSYKLRVKVHDQIKAADLSRDVGFRITS